MTKTPPEQSGSKPASSGAPSPLTVAAGARAHAPGHAAATPAPATTPVSAATPVTAAGATTATTKTVAPEPVTGAQSLVRSLEALGVDVMFGIPGGAILPAYDPIFDSKVRHILVRHEQGAGHAATGYAQATGKVGVCIATSGPGATNLVTPIADAYMDSVAMVAITGQVPRGSIGSDAFQEADIRGITLRKATRADSFGSEVRRRFGPLAAKWRMSEPVDDDKVVPSVSYRLGSLTYQWMHDSHEGEVSVLVRLEQDGVRHSIWLSQLVVAAGLGVAQNIRSGARTWRALQQAIESHTEWLERLHPHLSGPDAITFLDNVGATQS